MFIPRPFLQSLKTFSTSGRQKIGLGSKSSPKRCEQIVSYEPKVSTNAPPRKKLKLLYAHRLTKEEISRFIQQPLLKPLKVFSQDTDQVLHRFFDKVTFSTRFQKS